MAQVTISLAMNLRFNQWKDLSGDAEQQTLIATGVLIAEDALVGHQNIILNLPLHLTPVSISIVRHIIIIYHH